MDSDEDMLDASDSELMYDDDLYNNDGCGSDEIVGDYEGEDSQSLLTRRDQTSASLKFTVLNPQGRIWTVVAGGGASVIYADTVGDLGYASELGNYAEYSGAPNEEEVLQYARVVLDEIVLE